jgi:uncharacterized protein (UPF0303 family)
VKNAGMIAVVSVSGLRDEEAHQLIMDALNDEFIEK